MSRRGVDNEFAGRVLVVAGALGFVAQLMGGGVDVAASALGFVSQLMGGGVNMEATTGFDGELGQES